MKTETDKKKILSGAHATGIGATAVRDLVNVTWRMTVPTVLGVFIGMGVDSLFSSSPAGFLVGAVVGFVAGVYLALRLIKQASEAEK
ncbi:AtpZ/AtpI family protein [Pedobacter sp.]|nr:AtpZ/AtpI family protein [Candidatus Saccharibacteria bacterium]